MEKGPDQDHQSFQGAPPGGEVFPEEERQQLLVKLEEMGNKADEYLGLLQRLQADFVNYRKRVENVRAEAIIDTRVNVIGSILPVLDDFQMALASVPVGAGGLPWVQGVSMIERKLRLVLEEAGVKEIKPIGEEFNPWEHEAVVHEESEDFREGQVIDVLRAGYKIDSKIIRPAQVKVAKAKLPPADED